MAQYRGLKAIAERLGCAEITVARKIHNEGFLAYQVKRYGRAIWQTNDRLIELWELSKVKESQKGLKEWKQEGKYEPAYRPSA